jgi:hypothetical protein
MEHDCAPCVWRPFPALIADGAAEWKVRSSCKLANSGIQSAFGHSLQLALLAGAAFLFGADIQRLELSEDLIQSAFDARGEFRTRSGAIVRSVQIEVVAGAIKARAVVDTPRPKLTVSALAEGGLHYDAGHQGPTCSLPPAGHEPHRQQVAA